MDGGAYEVWGLLGQGGMSEVRLAKHKALMVPVVIKTMRGANTSTEDAQKRLLNEARVMAKIPDPRVVRAIDAGVGGDGRPYLVQEYVDGLDIAELDARRREGIGVGLPLWFVCMVLKETCRALHAAHQTGVVHRDVKPSNIFGSPETGLRLGDFGIAVVHDDCAQMEVSGTLGFMAPEQLKCEAAERTTDVYGAGATAYALRYGNYAFGTIEQILAPDVDARFPPPQHPAEGYFQQLVRTMLAKDPARRVSTASVAARHFAQIERAIRPTTTMHAPLVCVDKKTFQILGCRISLAVGDIAGAQADGIVSSANYHMQMRSGVGEALRRRGGDEIEAEAMKDGEHALGSCVVTGAGKLAAKKVLHAVSAWNETSCVGRTAQRAFLAADEHGLRSLAIPALGTGAARVSIETCANAMMTALRWHLALGGTRISEVHVVLDSEEKLRAFREVANEALRDQDEPPGLVDLGLPASGPASSPAADSATHIDVAALATNAR